MLHHNLTQNTHRLKPKRSLSAYNFFFAEERQRLLARLPTADGTTTTTVKRSKKRVGHGKISFAELGRTISAQWKKISPQEKMYYAELAMQDKFRYLREMREWRVQQQEQQPPQPQPQQQEWTPSSTWSPQKDGAGGVISHSELDDVWEPIQLDMFRGGNGPTCDVTGTHSLSQSSPVSCSTFPWLEEDAHYETSTTTSTTTTPTPTVWDTLDSFQNDTMNPLPMERSSSVSWLDGPHDCFSLPTRCSYTTTTTTNPSRNLGRSGTPTTATTLTTNTTSLAHLAQALGEDGCSWLKKIFD
jgi:hypothetical protein